VYYFTVGLGKRNLELRVVVVLNLEVTTRRLRALKYDNCPVPVTTNCGSNKIVVPRETLPLCTPNALVKFVRPTKSRFKR